MINWQFIPIFAYVVYFKTTVALLDTYNIIPIKNMRKLILVVFAVLSTTSIFAQKDKLSYQESSARSLEPSHAVMITPLVADMQLLGDRISYTEKDAFASYVITPNIVSDISTLKNIALSRAARAHNADAIVAATVDVVTNAEGKIEITISGYPVKYVNFRNATAVDVELQSKAQSFKDTEDVFDDRNKNTTVIK